MPASTSAWSRSFPAGPGSPGRLVGELPGRADERPARLVLLVPRLLADEHRLGAGLALAEDDLDTGLPEAAGLAAGRFLAQLRQACHVAAVPVTKRRESRSYDARRGAVAEWLGRGLQSLAHQFDSGRRLSVPPAGGSSALIGQTSRASSSARKTMRIGWQMRRPW